VENISILKEEETGGCRKFLSEKINNLYSSSYIIRIIKPRRMR
jgi:hypothetical protein